MKVGAATVLGSLLLATTSSFSEEWASVSATEIPVYDALLYRNKPDLRQIGLKSIRVIYEAEFWGRNENKHGLPRESSLIKIARSIKGDSIAVIDIEHWPYKQSMGNVDEGLNKYSAVVRRLKQLSPNARLGIYGLPPVRDYWRALAPEGSTDFDNWKKENDRVGPLSRELDVAFPSLYTFYQDPAAWVIYARRNIAEARRVSGGRPVIAFLCPQYHDSNRILNGLSVPGEFWKLQLETVRDIADGIVIWGGYKKDWDSNEAWWKETLVFLNAQ